MHKLFTSTNTEFQKHCTEYLKNKQIELNNIVELQNKYNINIMQKRSEYENKYEDYLFKYLNTHNNFDKVQLFKSDYPIKKKEFNIYTYQNYFNPNN
tara:strand:- start:242 stop:532 length:291 start_codon:yes stop_codon:yes gene_type:complete